MDRDGFTNCLQSVCLGWQMCVHVTGDTVIDRHFKVMMTMVDGKTVFERERS